MTFLVGKVALDITGGSPNNGRGEGNITPVKSLRKGPHKYPYVSAQAFRRWVRDSFPTSYQASPVTTAGKGKKQQAYTDGRPDLYVDDDLFGYMVAGSHQRDTVLATGKLVALSPHRITLDFGTMSRGFPAGSHPVIHEHEHYTSELAGDILLDLPRVGTFEQVGNTSRLPSLSKDAAVEAQSNGAHSCTLRGMECLQLPLTERRRRVATLLRTLAAVQGGANRASGYGDRAPSLVLLAPLKGGNNPFTRVLALDPRDHNGTGAVRFDTETFQEERKAWEDELDGPVLIGWAPGFLGEQREQVRRELSTSISSGEVIIDHPRVVLGNLAKEFEAGQRDAWMDDPSHG